MKKIYPFLFAILFITLSCETNDNLLPENEADTQDNMSVDMSNFEAVFDSQPPSRRDHRCATMDLLKEDLKEDPSLRARMYDIEYNVKKYLQEKEEIVSNGDYRTADPDIDVKPINDGLGFITIPVYVHVIYKTAKQNISYSQITSQIAVLNNDFKNKNYTGLPARFKNDVTSMGFRFVLKKVFRYKNNSVPFKDNNRFKRNYKAKTPNTHLNIWVTPLKNETLGFATFPGAKAWKDGVVIQPQYFGTKGYVEAPFDRGRTATHEIGHYVGLYHVWGDAVKDKDGCKLDDEIKDTPNSQVPYFGCDKNESTCGTVDMNMNFMDYRDDRCLTIFTDGQRNKARSYFRKGGFRASMIK
ncbi:zinc metalloprotease [uncultured Polaribacter sp.]|uniref:zinc metalloprotease n=1 Tax=uncultured Polaribacter sp. TaxID=174711 RepID=UPI00262569D7|nr:zinc metalloprotease [uncultured Polaribacter sp.]